MTLIAVSFWIFYTLNRQDRQPGFAFLDSPCLAAYNLVIQKE